MDMNTGKEYPTRQAAIDDGVAPADIAEVRLKNGKPIVKFSKGSFKSLVRNERGALVPVGKR
jgi:hypothetical protein